MLKRFINGKFRHICNLIGLLVPIKVYRTHEDAKMPTKAHTGLFEDAAWDLYATEELLFQYGQKKMIGTGLSLIIPDGYWIKLRERSGLASKGIHLLGGVIDSGYTGEVKVILWSCSPDPVSIASDKAICQFTLEKLSRSEVTELSTDAFKIECEKRTRGKKGFGSSDVKSK